MPYNLYPLICYLFTSFPALCFFCLIPSPSPCFDKLNNQRRERFQWRYVVIINLYNHKLIHLLPLFTSRPDKKNCHCVSLLFPMISASLHISTSLNASLFTFRVPLLPYIFMPPNPKCINLSRSNNN